MITLNNIPVSFLYDVPKAVDHKNIILDLIQNNIYMMYLKPLIIKILF